MIQLKAKFTYVIIPKLSTHAYLKVGWKKCRHIFNTIIILGKHS